MAALCANFAPPNPANLSQRPSAAIVRATEQHRRMTLARLTRRGILRQARPKAAPDR
jgi:hypothetical protein